LKILRYKLRLGPERTVRMILITIIKYLKLNANLLSIFHKIIIKGMITEANQSLRRTHFSLLKAIFPKVDQSIKNLSFSPNLKIKRFILKVKNKLKMQSMI
jgi:hypothetical protein